MVCPRVEGGLKLQDTTWLASVLVAFCKNHPVLNLIESATHMCTNKAKKIKIMTAAWSSTYAARQKPNGGELFDDVLFRASVVLEIIRLIFLVVGVSGSNPAPHPRPN